MTPAARGRMTPNGVYLWRHIKHSDIIKCCHQKRFEPSQETRVKMINEIVSPELISLWFAIVQVISTTVSHLWIYVYKKHKNGNSARRTVQQRHIWLPIRYGWSDTFQFGNVRTTTKIAISNFIFSRTADRISPRNFALYDNLVHVHQAQWHISKLCSFY